VFVEFFIRRPIFASVCALLIILAGAVSIPTLPIALYPSLAPPIVTVTSSYIGADAQEVEKDVTTILEEQINGVEGMRYIASNSANDGTSTITITFRTGYDLNVAAVDVQNRVAAVQARLPQAVINAGIVIAKANPNFVFAAGFYSDNNRYSQGFISNYLDVYVKDAINRVPGVGNVIIFGERKYAMRLWLDPAKLAARSLTATDVLAALQEQNVAIPAGQVGQPPANSTQSFQLSVHAVGRLTSPEDFDNIILKQTANGIVQLKDVGRAEIGAESYSMDLKFSGQPAIGLGIQQLSSANALDVDRQAKAALINLSKQFPPGLHYTIAFDTTTVVGDSIREVLNTLVVAVIIVIAVIFLFLLDWRATIIPAVTIPVSLIGAFTFIKLFGFSINSLTLFGITLATGLVVDDAIVVIENVQRHISRDHTDPHHATSVAMSEVTGAVIATSLVLIAVFLPVAFFPGTTGILYKQFSLTIAFSIAISAFNALTLSPALSALLLRGEEAKLHMLDWTGVPILAHGYAHFAEGVDSSIHWLAVTYGRVIHAAVRLRYILLVVFIVGLAATVFEYTHVPTSFLPNEDQGYLMVLVLAPQGSSLDNTVRIADAAEAVMGRNPDIIGAFSLVGFSLSGGNASNSGLMFAALKPSNERRAKGHTADDILADIGPKVMGAAMQAGGLAQVFEPPAVQGIGSFGGFQFELQGDPSRNSLADLDAVAHKIVAAGNSRKDLSGLFTSFTSNDPQLLLSIDREKAKAMNVSIGQITDTLGVFMGSEYVNDFDYNNRSYRVFAQADSPFRMTESDIRSFYVRSGTGDMVPLENLVTIQQSSSPQVIPHYNLYRSVEIDGSSAPGYSSSEGLKAMQQIAANTMQQGMHYEWTGLALEELQSGGTTILIFALGILVVYLTLAALYESWVLPFIILLAVPMAVLGALLAVSARGLANDVYVQIGLVMLIGLSAKNAILIVEFAEQLRAKGRSILDAAVEAGELRLRPILMTSFAFILGVLPLVFATGAGSQGRHSVGTAIVGGMLLSTVLNLIFIPVLYVLTRSLVGGTPRTEPAVQQFAEE
jgi:HAE1 family hydrophobic/amphiphilic exporter-1